MRSKGWRLEKRHWFFSRFLTLFSTLSRFMQNVFFWQNTKLPSKRLHWALFSQESKLHASFQTGRQSICSTVCQSTFFSTCSFFMGKRRTTIWNQLIKATKKICCGKYVLLSTLLVNEWKLLVNESLALEKKIKREEPWFYLTTYSTYFYRNIHVIILAQSSTLRVSQPKSWHYYELYHYHGNMAPSVLILWLS